MGTNKSMELQAEIEIMREEIVEYTRVNFFQVDRDATVEQIELAINKEILQRFPKEDTTSEGIEKRDAKVRIFIDQYYQDLPKMMDAYFKKEAEYKELEKEEERQLKLLPYIEKLKAVGKVASDGKTVNKSLRDVACFLGREGILITEKLLRDNFLSRDGNVFGDSNIKKARVAGNSTSVPYDKRKII